MHRQFYETEDTLAVRLKYNKADPTTAKPEAPNTFLFSTTAGSLALDIGSMASVAPPPSSAAAAAASSHQAQDSTADKKSKASRKSRAAKTASNSIETTPIQGLSNPLYPAKVCGRHHQRPSRTALCIAMRAPCD